MAENSPSNLVETYLQMEAKLPKGAVTKMEMSRFVEELQNGVLRLRKSLERAIAEKQPLRVSARSAMATNAALSIEEVMAHPDVRDILHHAGKDGFRVNTHGSDTFGAVIEICF